VSLNCPDCGVRVMNLRTHVCKSRKSSDGGGESRLASPHESGDVRRDVGKKASPNSGRLLAGVAPSPSDHKIVEGLKEALLVAQGEIEPARITVKLGRPKIGEVRDRPWEKLGISERTWYRRQAEKRK
jgi:hypothetical protein